MDTLQITNNSDHRQVGLDHHPLIPSSFWTQFRISGFAICRAKTEVGQRNRAFFQLNDHGMKIMIGGVERGRGPIDHLTVVIEDPTQADPDCPAPLSFDLAPTCYSTTS